MSVPKQPFGLNTFTTSFSKCPPNPDAIRAIVIQSNNLAVVNGANTELQLLLQKFFVTVNQASISSFTLPARTSATVPFSLSTLDFSNQNVKFLCLYPKTFENPGSSGPTGATVSLSTEYVEWTSQESLIKGTLYNKPAVVPYTMGGPSASSSTTSFDINTVNSLEFGWGGNISFTGGTGPLWIGSNGGLMKWDGTSMKLWNTLNTVGDNSEGIASPSDYINSLAVDPNNNVWVGASGGLSFFNESTGFSYVYNVSNSSILSDSIKDVKILANGNIAIATDMGLSIFNFTGATWQNFNVFSTPQLSYNNINKLAVSGNIIFMGTTGGVFMYDSGSTSWGSSPFNSFNTPGWTAPNNITSLSVLGNNLYAGTTGGIVAIPYMGGTATTFISGMTGPVSNIVLTLRALNYGSNNLYVGHDTGISVYNIDTNSWTGYTASSGVMGSVDALIPDFLSGSTSGQTIFYGSHGSTSSIAYKLFTSSPSVSPVPESNKSTNLLLSYPNTMDSLYSAEQNIYFIFSKPITPSTAETNTSLQNTDTLGVNIPGGWTVPSISNAIWFTPSFPMLKAAQYNLIMDNGITAIDGSYVKESLNFNFYTEDLIPELGWNPLGKIMILTGTDGDYLQNLYFRNPQGFDVQITAMIGTI